MNIAILGCKKQKQNYSCKAEEMYSKSKTFRKQLQYCKEVGYDAIYIFSVQYGIIGLDEMIEPYDLTLNPGKAGQITKDHYKIATQEHIDNLIMEVSNKLNAMDGQIDFHTYSTYYNLVKNKLTGNHRQIKQQRQTTQIGVAYEKAIEEYKQTQDIKKAEHIIGYKEKMNRPKEEPQTWYHPTLGTFFGKHTDLIQKYKNVNPGTAYIVVMNHMGVKIGNTTTKHIKGWHLDPTLEFYQVNNKWRVKKCK